MSRAMGSRSYDIWATLQSGQKKRQLVASVFYGWNAAPYRPQAQAGRTSKRSSSPLAIRAVRAMALVAAVAMQSACVPRVAQRPRARRAASQALRRARVVRAASSKREDAAPVAAAPRNAALAAATAFVSATAAAAQAAAETVRRAAASARGCATSGACSARLHNAGAGGGVRHLQAHTAGRPHPVGSTARVRRVLRHPGAIQRACSACLIA